jgi:CheY-like chemotaxis protein
MASVLVALPDPDERGLAVFALRFAGHHVVDTAGMPETVLVSHNIHPDLVVLDDSLPGIFQSELWQSFTNDPSMATPPLVLVTSQAPSPVPQSITEIIRRPICADELATKVNKALKKSSNRGSRAHT